MRIFSISSIVALAAFLTIAFPSARAENRDVFISKEDALKLAGRDPNMADENEKIMLAANANEKKLRSELGDVYGGSWIDYDSSGRAYQVVAAVDAIIVNKEYSKEVNLKIVEVKYSLKQLESLGGVIAEKFFSLKDAEEEVLIFWLDIDQKRNKIILNAKPSNFNKIKSIFKENNLNIDMLEFKGQDAPERPAAKTVLYGGSSIVTANRGTPSWSNDWKSSCTAGFNARLDGTSVGVVITAGHCELADDSEAAYVDNGGSNSPKMGAYIGDFLANGFYKYNIDGVLYGNVNEVYDLAPVITRSPLGDFGVMGTMPITNMIRGSQICSYGKVSGWRCGNLLSIDAMVNRDGRLLRLAIAEFCAEGGDSGGPVVYPDRGNVGASAGNAIGIVSGYIDKGNLGCHNDFSGIVKTTIQSLNTYLERWPNVKVLTR